MQTSLRLSRRLPAVKITNLSSPRTFHSYTPAMSLFPRFHEISPIFRIIDECDRASRQARPGSQHVRTFSPRFDVSEVQDQYELTGELPGIEQNDINISWTDASTLSITGRAEYRSERGSPRPEAEASTEADASSSKQATVEESVDDDLVEVEKPESTEATEASTPTATAEVPAPAALAESKARYWVKERSVGQFRRTFTFPTRVEQDAVKASLKNGVLNIVVPKTKPKEPQRINIE